MEIDKKYLDPNFKDFIDDDKIWEQLNAAKNSGKNVK